MRFLVVGDPLLPAAALASAVRDVFGTNVQISEVDWQPANEEEFWFLRSQVEKLGPGAGKAACRAERQDPECRRYHHSPYAAERTAH